MPEAAVMAAHAHVAPIRTLDAIHLASVDVIEAPPWLVTIVTRDGRVRENAIALGYATA